MSVNIDELPRLKDDFYAGGYVFKPNPIVIAPSEGDTPFTLDDVWTMRLIYGSDGRVVTPTKSLDGDNLVLSFVFTSADTAEFARHGTIRRILEKGSSDGPVARAYGDWLLRQETKPVRPQDA